MVQALLIVMCATLLGLAVGYASAEDSISLGSSLFNEGKGRDGRIVSAHFGAGAGVQLDGAAVACGGCHGKYGRGGGESFVQAPDIRWRSLTAPFGARRVGGRPRPAYTKESFATVLSSGVSSDKQRLDPAMPRFNFATDEIEALIKYLQQIDGGHSANRPTLVMLLPQFAGDLHQRLAEQLSKCAVSTGFPLMLEVIRYNSANDALNTLEQRISKGKIAAVFASYTPGWEARFSAFLRKHSLISVMPLLQVEPDDIEQMVFRLPAARAQLLALMQGTLKRDASLHIADQLKNHKGDGELLEWVRAQAGRMGLLRKGEGFDPRPAEWLWLGAGDYRESSFKYSIADADRVLVPSTHMDGLELIKSSTSELHIAFPYKTRMSGSDRRINPAKVWEALGCELLSQMTPLPAFSEGVLKWKQQLLEIKTLSMGEWLVVPAQSHLVQDITRVSIERVQ